MSEAIASSWEEMLSEYKNKHLAIVHQYLPPKDVRDIWYHQWGMSVIGFLGMGFELLGLDINILDIETFRKKESSEIGQYDYCLSLICGNKDIVYWTIAPSISAWCGVKPLPASADTIVAGERKDIANVFAREVGILTPRTYSRLDSIPGDKVVVVKPRDYGSSVGIICGQWESISNNVEKSDIKNIIQDYVSGIDITVPVLFNPETKKYDVGKAVATYSTSSNDLWMFDGDVKSYIRVGDAPDNVKTCFVEIPTVIKDKISSLIDLLGGSSVSRVDMRIKNYDPESTALPKPENFYFIEVNPVPTMSDVSQYTQSIHDSISEKAMWSESLWGHITANVHSKNTASVAVAYSMLKHSDITSTHSV